MTEKRLIELETALLADDNSSTAYSPFNSALTSPADSLSPSHPTTPNSAKYPFLRNKYFRITVSVVLLACSITAISLALSQTEQDDTIDCDAQEYANVEKEWIPPYWTLAVFICFLLGIVIMPFVAPRFWEHNRNKAKFTAMFSIPFAIYVIAYQPLELAYRLLEYFQFCTLIFALYVISGGILVDGDIQPTPRNNTIFLLIGTLLSSFIGTTGACMLLIRPLLRSNQERKNIVHTVIFFIFLVGNIGGILTPLGDPPLFLGYISGVPFTWTFKLWKIWLFTFVILLSLYYVIDTIMWKKEIITTQVESAIKIHGEMNMVFLYAVILIIFFNPYIGEAMIKSGMSKETVYWIPLREIVLLSLSYISYKTTDVEIRKAQKFSFEPFMEVVILFFGIFVTMIPTLLILYDFGPKSPINSPWSFFWVSGTLSSFLDNSPTYLTFLSLALGQGVSDGANFVVLSEGCVQESKLMAISAGSVFMGAMSYIGNAPNFMVKSIAEENNVKMPNFIGYMSWSFAILGPIFLIITFIFFS